jgi:hypothetical protein
LAIRAGFRCPCSKERVGSSPTARTRCTDHMCLQRPSTHADAAKGKGAESRCHVLSRTCVTASCSVRRHRSMRAARWCQRSPLAKAIEQFINAPGDRLGAGVEAASRPWLDTTQPRTDRFADDLSFGYAAQPGGALDCCPEVLGHVDRRLLHKAMVTLLAPADAGLRPRWACWSSPSRRHGHTTPMLPGCPRPQATSGR